MSMIEEEIKDFIVNNSIEIEEVNNDTCLNIRKAVNELYGDENKKGLWLWEKLKCFDTIIDKDGWSYINEFVSDNACIVFFNEFDEKKMFKIKNGNDLYYLLSETSGFEFYITDFNYSYLICFNHHDILYGCGRAKKWIAGLRRLNRK
ncbi:hypothetical protein SAMN02910289_01150 [Lachnospiraceae bacterium RM5]|nr:hypothetical protein SAMN02910289_01150 [Lachnospiraceae bacterium RM5]